MKSETCMVGQWIRCGNEATHAIAVRAIKNTAFSEGERDGGVIFLCEFHATTPVSDWDNHISKSPERRAKEQSEA